MTLVLDASVLCEFLVASPVGVTVKQAIDEHGNRIHIPHLAVTETAAVLDKWVRRSLVPESRARTALDDLQDVRATRWEAEPHLPRIWELRRNLSVYDATYVALAESLDATLLTADARLARGAEGRARCAVELVSATAD